MKIVVAGGTGLIGSKTVAILRQGGHEVVAASPKSGVNSITGEGLKEAMAGTQVAIDLTNSPSFENQAVLEFLETSGRNLLAAETAARVRHHVALSIVGIDRTDNGYFRAKLAQEKLIAAAGIPYTIIRATQFLEFLGGIAERYRTCEPTRTNGMPVPFRRSFCSVDRARPISRETSRSVNNCSIGLPSAMRSSAGASQRWPRTGARYRCSILPFVDYIGRFLRRSRSRGDSLLLTVLSVGCGAEGCSSFSHVSRMRAQSAIFGWRSPASYRRLHSPSISCQLDGLPGSPVRYVPFGAFGCPTTIPADGATGSKCAGQHRRCPAVQHALGVAGEAIEPAQLVIEFWARRRIAVRQVEASDNQVADRGLDVAAVHVIGIPGPTAAGLDRLGAARQDRHAIPALLSVPDRALARRTQRRRRKFLVGCLQLLQAHDVRRRFFEPAQQIEGGR
jgi:hypothetical protein